MIKYYLPGHAVRAAATHDGKYIFYLGKTIHVFDTTAQKKIASLPRLGNTDVTVSRNDAYLGCMHPMDRKIEAVIFRIQNPPVELFRIPIRGQNVDTMPCFTYDSQYLLVVVGWPIHQLYAIHVETGEHFLVYETPAHNFISDLVATEKGVFVFEHESCAAPVEFPIGRILLFPTVTSEPLETPFDRAAFDRFRKQLGVRDVTTKGGGFSRDKLLLQYTYESRTYPELTLESRLEVIPFPTGAPFQPSPDVAIPYGIFSIASSTDGKYVAINSMKFGKVELDLVVYRTTDWKLIYKDSLKYLWDLQFIPNSHDLIVCGENSRVITISDDMASSTDESSTES